MRGYYVRRCIGPQVHLMITNFWRTLPTAMLPLLDTDVILHHIRDCDIILFSVRRPAVPRGWETNASNSCDAPRQARRAQYARPCSRC